VEAETERLERHGPVLAGHLADELGPEAVAAHRDQRRRRRVEIVVAHDDEPQSRDLHGGVVARVRADGELHVPRGAVVVGEVQRPRPPHGTRPSAFTSSRSSSSSWVVTAIFSAAKSSCRMPSTTSHDEPSLRTGNPNWSPSGTPYCPVLHT